MTNVRVKPSDIFIQSGTERTVYITWTAVSANKKKNLKHYEVEWQWASGNITNGDVLAGNYWTASEIDAAHDKLRWFPGNTENVDKNKTISVYNVPDTAVSVKVRVKPVRDTSVKTNKKKNITAWTGKWNEKPSWKYKDFGNLPTLETPSTPSITISGNRVTARVDNYNEDASKNARINFQVVQDDTTKIADGSGEVKTGTAIYTTAVLPEGHRYKVRAQAAIPNTLYRSAWSEYSSNVYTTPSAPSNRALTIEAKSESSVKLSWNAFPSAISYVIKWASEKWMFDVDQGVDQTDSDSTSVLITGIETGKKWFFRVYGKNESGQISSVYISADIILGTKPAPPTTWSESSTVTNPDEAVLYFIHNAQDGSKMQKSNIYLEKFAPGVTPKDSRHAAGRITIPYNVIGLDSGTVVDYQLAEAVYDDTYKSFFADITNEWTIRWSVSTFGVYSEGSDYSVARDIMVYTKPSMTIRLEPSDTVFPLKLTISTSPSTTNILSYDIKITSTERYVTEDAAGRSRIIGINESVYSRVIVPSNGSDHNYAHTITAGDVMLETGITYNIAVTTAFANGLSASGSVDYTPSYEVDTDYDIDADVFFDTENYTASINPYAVVDADADEFEYVSDVTLAVYRREYDGSLSLIQDGIPNDGTTYITDPHPSLDIPRYRIVTTHTSSGVTDYADIEGDENNITSAIIQWDDDWGNHQIFEDEEEDDADRLVEPSYAGHILVLPYNIKVSDTNSLDVEFANYIGRRHPVSYYGTHVGTKNSWSADIPKTDTDRLFLIRQLAAFMGDCYVREPSGIGYWAQVNVNYSRDYDSLIIPVSLDITRVDGGV